MYSFFILSFISESYSDIYVLNIFENCDVQRKMLNHLEEVFRIAYYLKARRLVFGSPRNRDRSGLSNQEAFEIATSFFKQLAEVAQQYKVIVCLEPNPECYGSNFMTTSEETAAVVNAVNHPSIKMQFDTGAISINNEVPFEVCSQYKNLIGHVHLSDPNLTPLGLISGNHKDSEAALRTFLPDFPVTIEMLRNPSIYDDSILEESIRFTCEFYRNNNQIKLS